jgi:hypothetical protein
MGELNAGDGTKGMKVFHASGIWCIKNRYLDRWTGSFSWLVGSLNQCCGFREGLVVPSACWVLAWLVD